jgi:hypothetical protein
METAQGGLSAADHIMVFQTFDNTAPRFFGASDLPGAPPWRSLLTAKPNEYGASTVHRVIRAPANSACKIGITVYHQTHQR